MNPVIGMDIVLPTADQQTRNIVKNSITTEEEKTKQFLSLLVLNSFYTEPGQAAGYNGSTASAAGVATSELLSNQLSNWLSQISNDFDIGFNYRPGDEISSDEVELALSTQLINDKLTINTNLDVSTQNQSLPGENPNNIVGEFNLDFKLTENGKVHLKAFNRANDDIYYETAPYTQGVGVSFREDFNSFGELLKRYKESIARIFRKKENKEKTVYRY